MGHFFSYVAEPGLLSSGPVRTAVLVGTVVAITSGVVGVLTVYPQPVVRRALPVGCRHHRRRGGVPGRDQPFWGFLIAGVAAAAVMELIGVQRRRGRDVATGVVLGAALGVAALFLYLGTPAGSTTGASFTILFGSMFVITPDTVPALIASGILALAVIAVLSGCCCSPRSARSSPPPGASRCGRSAPPTWRRSPSRYHCRRWPSARCFSTALLIGPAATALRLARSPGRSMIAAAAIGTAATWLGILLSYDSYYWTPDGRSWPVSFFVVALVIAGYLLSHARRPPRCGQRPQRQAGRGTRRKAR